MPRQFRPEQEDDVEVWIHDRRDVYKCLHIGLIREDALVHLRVNSATRPSASPETTAPAPAPAANQNRSSHPEYGTNSCPPHPFPVSPLLSSLHFYYYPLSVLLFALEVGSGNLSFVSLSLPMSISLLISRNPNVSVSYFNGHIVAGVGFGLHSIAFRMLQVLFVLGQPSTTIRSHL